MLPKKISKTNTYRRTAALLCAALTGLGLAALGRPAQAAPSGPLTTSPPTPVPFQSPVYHSGGGPTPYPVAAAATPPATPVPPTVAPYLTPLIDPLQGQLQGTPTELYNGSITQIPSYSIGNYDPTRPPAGLSGGVNTYYPNHFADGGIFSWSAPFSYVSQSAGTVTVDDNAAVPTGAPPTTSGFAYTTGWSQITSTATGPSYPAAGTATNAEYLRLPSGTNGTATWTLYEPVAGSYSIYFHIPSDLPDSNGLPEVRDTQVVYAISIRDAAGNVTATTTATASQTEANDSQFLAGPFNVAATGSVVVTLTRSSGPVIANNNADFLVADSMTLQQTVGDVQSAPTAITYDLYPTDFSSTVHPLQYWGIFVPPTASLPTSGQQTGGSTAAVNANPDTTTTTSPPTTGTGGTFNSGNILLKSGNAATALGQTGTPDPLRRIRQLVYFGRSDPAASVSSSVDDSAGLPTGTPASGFNANGAFTSVTNTTASNGGYKSFAATEGAVATAAPAATWTVPVPTANVGASFFVYAHIPANSGNPAETRLSQVYYTVTTSAGTYGPVAISQVTQGADALVALPTGALTAAAGTSIIVRLYSVNNSTTTAPASGSVVVADSVTVSTGTGQGAIYCVDGFTGGVVWRYETPGSVNGSSAPVFASPVITKINVLVTPAIGAVPAIYANRLVAIVGDNNGLVYCLDAIGNGDGTSNANVLNATTGAPLTIPQPAYGGLYGAVGTTPLLPTDTAAADAATAHVGTTGVYWVYRPDAFRPKFVTGGAIGAVKTPDPTTDLPVPAAFATASPNVFVDPTVPTTIVAPATTLKSNATVYIGNSNGVLYALDALGAGIDGTTATTYTASGDKFNVSQTGGGFDVPTGTNSFPLTAVVPTPQPLWWFSLRGVNPNGGDNASSADIESAPAIYVKDTPAAAPATTDTFTPTVYIGSAHELETTSNVGRLYALSGLYGPSGNNGRSPSDPAASGYAPPGSFNYNVGQRPQDSPADTADWSFPDAVGKDTYTTKSQSSNGKPRPALGNVTGSPVVFTNTDENAANQNADGSPRQTRIFFAASSGYEATTATPTPIARPDDGTTGRLWAVNLDGTVGTTVSAAATTKPTAVPTPTTGTVWSYPLANDPNDAALTNVAEPDSPMGAFLRATPAIGFVQFPTTTTNGDNSAYDPADAVHTGINGQSVPMLYVGTDGVNDTALYALDIDGDMTSDSEGTATGTDTRTIYRVVSPDGSIFQSSPALVANASSTGGNGGGVYAVAGNTLYDYSATPISNPFTGQAYPLIRENAAFAGFGPISSPALAGADTTDLSTAFLASYTAAGAAGVTNTSQFTTNTTDWIYVGDSSSGLCRGITPNDSSYGGIAVGLGSIVPYDPNAPSEYTLDAIIQAFLVKTQTSTTSADALPVGTSAPLQVYEWGESAYARFSNVAPPNPQNDPALYVYDSLKYTLPATASNIVPFYRSDGTQAQSVQFNVSDASTSGGLGDLKYVNPQLLLAPKTPPDGFIVDSGAKPAPIPNVSDAFTSATTNLADSSGKRYLGTYTYAIGDGSVLANTPGARRRFQNVKQTVDVYTFDGTTYTPAGTTIISGDATNENLVSQKIVDPTTGAVTYGFNANSKIAAVDQPTFGILNPLGVRGGGVNLLLPNSAAVPIGDTVSGELGPFRSVMPPPTLSTTGGTTTTTAGDNYALQALANGNDVPTVAPPSSSGVGGSPIVRPAGVNDPTAVTAPTTTNVVVTTTGEIAHNTTGDNGDGQPSTSLVTGQYSVTTSDGLLTATFGGYALDLFDRSALYTLGQTLRLKMTVPSNVAYSPPAGKDGLYWNSNAINNTGHDSVVNFLPWETPPVPYTVGVGNMTNGSQDYPDIAPGNITQTALSIMNKNGVINAGGDLTSNSVTLTPGYTTTTAPNRIVTADPVRIQVAVPRYQPANQQLYQQTPGQAYSTASTSQISPVDDTGANQINVGNNPNDQVFPMGYITTKRLYVPDARGFTNPQRPYRDVRIYTGVPIDMRTSVADTSATTDIGKVPAAFGVQTEADPTYGLFSPYGSLASGTYQPSPFQPYFKPLEVHNDGNVNLLNVHFDQKVNNGAPATLQLFSDTIDPLSFLDSYDINDITGPRPTTSLSPIPEQPFLIRTSIDTDLMAAYGRNPVITGSTTLSQVYPGATFHKPIPGGSQPSTLTVPDAPERYVAGASLDNTPNGLPVIPSASGVYKALPYVSLAVPFGTPVGTYSTPGAQAINSLRLFEGLDPAAPSGYNPNTMTGQLYPPVYGGAIGGSYGGTSTKFPTVNSSNGEITGTNSVDEGVYNGTQPLSTSGAQLIGHVLEQRLTDGATYGAVPMIDAAPAGSATPPGGTTAVPVSTPDFAPAAFRDPNTGDLSVYWTSGRTAGTFGIFGANLPFKPNGNTPGVGYFLPDNPSQTANPVNGWWQSIGGYNAATPPGLLPLSGLAAGTNSGLSITQGPSGTNYAFDVAVGSTAPYSNTLYSYTAAADTGALTSPLAVTPLSSASQVKYGIKGFYDADSNFANSLWAFWTGTTRGRTALYYNVQGGSGTNGAWGAPALLPVPAGLTAVADASPMRMPMPPVNGKPVSVLEVTYSGTAPDGNIDLYTSRYQPHVKTSAQDTTPPSQLDLAAFPPVTENLKAVGGWYQARDVAWSRTGALNVSVVTSAGTVTPLLYSSANVPLFTKAVYDKSSGLLVLTHVTVPGSPPNVFYTVYVDAPTGRIRFSPALSAATQTFAFIRATFSAEARRLTTDSRADTAPVTFMDLAPKPNDAALVTGSMQTATVETDRRWTIWRKAGSAGVSGSASLYFKAQRLTYFVPTAIDPAKALTITLNGATYSGPAVDVDYERGRLYFPIASGAEGQSAVVTYTAPGATAQTTTPTDAANTVQWQDEPLANNNDVPPADSAAGLSTVLDYGVPIDTAVNENNVAAFLDPFASATSSHKVWLFWNSTRNGTADIYSETIDPRFAPGP